MNSTLKQSVRNGLLVAGVSLGLVGIGFVFAAPTAPPPGSNLSLPLTRGAGAEIKAGALTVQGGLTVTNTLTVDRICLAGDCQTEWPSGGVSGSATVNGAGYHTSSYCNGYSAYEQLTYYRYGSLYNSYQYNCGPTSFSLTLPATIPSGSTPVALGGAVWCHGGTSNYSSYSPATTYVTDNYYNYRIQATVNSIINNNNGTVTINGNCKFLGGGSNYVYMAMRAQDLQLLY